MTKPVETKWNALVKFLLTNPNISEYEDNKIAFKSTSLAFLRALDKELKIRGTASVCRRKSGIASRLSPLNRPSTH
jgi:hypothetical protein